MKRSKFYRVIRTVGIVGIVLIAVMGISWLWLGHTAYHTSWASKESVLELSSYSPSLLLVAKSVINDRSARIQLVKLSAQNLMGLGMIGHGMIGWHATQLELLPYINFVLDSDEVYRRVLGFGYFGAVDGSAHPIYGISGSAKFFWNTGAENLSLSQSALLVALNWSPSRYDPRKKPEAALKKRNEILVELGSKGSISKEEVAQATSDPLGVQ